MKKLLILLIAVFSMQFAYADMDGAANIKIKISGAFQRNDYFLCLPNVGCLSIKAAQKGKIYPILRPVEMDNMYILDVTDFQLYPQGLPKSCDVTVNANQTITISGRLVNGPDHKYHVNQLRCSVS